MEMSEGLEANTEANVNPAVMVMVNGSILKHTFLMLSMVFVMYPIDYSFYQIKSKMFAKHKYYAIFACVNTLLLIIFCIDATYVSKPAYLDFIRNHGSSTEQLRTKQTFHSTFVPYIIVVQCLQLVPIIMQFSMKYTKKLSNYTLTNRTNHNSNVNASVSFKTQILAISESKVFKILLKFIHFLKIFFIIMMLPLEIYCGIININFGTLSSNLRPDFFDQDWNYGHLFPILPYYWTGIYYIWNHKYLNGNTITDTPNKRVLWFKKVFFKESIIMMLMAFVQMLGEVRNQRYPNSVGMVFGYWDFDVTHWYTTTWHHTLLATFYFICGVLTLLIRFTSNKNNSGNINSIAATDYNSARVRAAGVDSDLFILNTHNVLIGSTVIIYGFGLTMHHPSSSHREAIPGMHALAGNVAMLVGILRIMITWPLTLKVKLKLNEASKHMYNNTNNKVMTATGADTNEYDSSNVGVIASDIFNIMEEWCLVFIALIAMCHVFLLLGANPHLAYAWSIDLGFPSLAYVILIFIIGTSVWGAHLVASKVYFKHEFNYGYHMIINSSTRNESSTEKEIRLGSVSSKSDNGNLVDSVNRHNSSTNVVDVDGNNNIILGSVEREDSEKQTFIRTSDRDTLMQKRE